MGGSVITDKNTYRTFREDPCRKIVRSLLSFNEKLMITHGAGSFGHILAKDSGFPKKFNHGDEHNFSAVHRDVTDLNSMVLEVLLEEGLSPVSIPTQSIFHNKSQDYSSFKRYMNMGFTPVGFGDVLLDDGMIRIISADDLLLGLSSVFKPELVIFFTDVDGIYDKDPKTSSGAKLLKTIDRDIAFHEVINDVTGGMKSKYEKILEIRKHSGKVVVMNGNNPERLQNIDKDEFIGTVI